MRGKKVNLEFIGQFIMACSQLGKSGIQEILAEAEKRIVRIDEDLIRIEELKKERSNLQDVLSLFKKQNGKTDNIKT